MKNRVFFTAEVKNYSAEMVEVIIKDLEDRNYGWTWKKDGNIKYWYK